VIRRFVGFLRLAREVARIRRVANRLADYLPSAALAAPGVVLKKDGNFQRTAKEPG